MTVLASIRKNAREELRVSRDEYKGHDMINLRVFYDAGDEMRPGKQGIAFKAELLPELLNALRRAQEAQPESREDAA
ncbi:transcriptional coactivator p15/PC4 family protein [Histidinibacterium aquaticum]|uniref:Transcriptional coactivator p15 n=1 Tax=Histidinibacterium aquaticum TaxID=2613962 RepID=A0A5J5GDS1_9RHOB|nr:transcriptional coactivator p15/PC4 family protein [Histidinibacterium aquaticum]KAA9005942.1 transcriptional coactivator p15 [Histidinibacterium aquaticum]